MCAYDNRQFVKYGHNSKIFQKFCILFDCIQIDCLFMAMMSGGESGGKDGEPSCATGGTIWISQEFNITQNFIYLPSRSTNANSVISSFRGADQG